MTLQAIFFLTTTVAQIPTGYFADKVGRKTSILLRNFLVLIASFLYFIGNDFNAFALVEFCWGLSVSFFSGAEEALVYDSLKSVRMEKKYGKLYGEIAKISLYLEGNPSSFYATIISPKSMALFTARKRSIAKGLKTK